VLGAAGVLVTMVDDVAGTMNLNSRFINLSQSRNCRYFELYKIMKSMDHLPESEKIPLYSGAGNDAKWRRKFTLFNSFN
jgi:hypothetical protein